MCHGHHECHDNWALNFHDKPRINRTAPPHSTLGFQKPMSAAKTIPWPSCHPTPPPQLQIQTYIHSSHFLSATCAFCYFAPLSLSFHFIPSFQALFQASPFSVIFASLLLHLAFLFPVSSEILDAMDATNERKAIFIPRMVREWKRKPDGAWLTRTNLIKYWTRLTGTVDIARCEAS